MELPAIEYTGGASPISHSTPVLAWLLAPLRAPDALKVLKAADFLCRARMLDLESFLRTHLVSQLQQFGSWHHAVTALASIPAAQPLVLPACPPLTAEQEERKRRRHQIAHLKNLPSGERWHPLVRTIQGWHSGPAETTATAIVKPISVSQLSRANQQIPSSLWKGLIEAVLAAVSPAMGCGEMPDVGPVRAIDASLFRVSSSFAWARYQPELQAAKILVEYDVVTALVQAPILTEGRVHEATTVRTLPKQPGTTYLWDRGFWSFADFDDYCRRGVYFVTRCKENTVVAPLTAYPVPAHSSIVADEEVVIGNGVKRMEHSVRLVTVRGEDDSTFRLVTNRFDLPAHVISSLYRNRWRIELFFRWLKHYFPTRRFFGQSQEAVYAQIAAAFIAHILLVHRHRQLGYRGSLLEFARCVAAQLFAPVPTAWLQATA